MATDKKQFSISVRMSTYETLVRIAEESGLSISRICDLRLEDTTLADTITDRQREALVSEYEDPAP